MKTIQKVKRYIYNDNLTMEQSDELIVEMGELPPDEKYEIIITIIDSYEEIEDIHPYLYKVIMFYKEFLREKNLLKPNINFIFDDEYIEEVEESIERCYSDESYHLFLKKSFTNPIVYLDIIKNKLSILNGTDLSSLKTASEIKTHENYYKDYGILLNLNIEWNIIHLNKIT